MHRRITLTIVFVIAVLMIPAPAFASFGDYRSDNGGVSTEVGTGGDSGGSGGGGGGSQLSCGYNPVDARDVETANLLAQQGALAGGGNDGVWFQQLCTDPEGNIVISNVIWVSNADPKTLAQKAFQYAPLPNLSISLNPSTDRDQIVNLPTWLWLNSSAWQPVSATASVGGLTATTTATPSSIVWNTGDGEQLTCNGPGVAYDPSKPESAQHGDCVHTYRRSSASAPNGRFTVTATVRWHVTWTASGFAPGSAIAGDLGVITRSVTTTVRVAEVQALNRVS